MSMVYFSQFERFERAAPGTPRWLQALRRSAIRRFGELGFPTTRQEEWRHTNVAPLAKAAFQLAEPHANGLTARALAGCLIAELECCNLVFINGRFSAGHSCLCALSGGARAGSLAAALQSDPGALEEHLARYAPSGENPFTALNTAFLADGAYVFIPDGVVLDQVVHLVYISTAPEGAVMSHPHNLIVAGRRSQASIVESYVGLRDDVYFTNAVTEIVAGEGAVIEHTKLQRESERAYHIATIQAAAGARASLTSYAILLGGGLTRNELRVLLEGEGGECRLDGLYLAKGTQHMDTRTTVDHAAPHAASRQLYKGILDGRSSGVFHGRIVVRPDAQQTDARQTNRNLLLSDDAVIDSKPQLEIRADDVRCTHGAAIGRLDEEALFYLRTRGLDEAAARNLLTYAFASEISSAMKLKPLQCQVDLLLLNRLARDGRPKEAE